MHRNFLAVPVSSVTTSKKLVLPNSSLIVKLYDARLTTCRASTTLCNRPYARAFRSRGPLHRFAGEALRLHLSRTALGFGEPSKEGCDNFAAACGLKVVEP